MQDRIIQRIIGYLDENTANNVRTERIAAYVHLNKSYLCRVFKKGTGVTIGRYLMSRRVVMAKQMLRTEEADLASIAERAGLQDASYLCRVFKRMTGETPHQYRKRCADAQSGQHIDKAFADVLLSDIAYLKK